MYFTFFSLFPSLLLCYVKIILLLAIINRLVSYNSELCNVLFLTPPKERFLLFFDQFFRVFMINFYQWNKDSFNEDPILFAYFSSIFEIQSCRKTCFLLMNSECFYAITAYWEVINQGQYLLEVFHFLTEFIFPSKLHQR